MLQDLDGMIYDESRKAELILARHVSFFRRGKKEGQWVILQEDIYLTPQFSHFQSHPAK